MSVDDLRGLMGCILGHGLIQYRLVLVNVLEATEGRHHGHASPKRSLRRDHHRIARSRVGDRRRSDRVGEWSHECGGAEWVDGATTARPGARFRGTNRVGRSRWSRVCEVVTADAPHEVSWRTVSTWRFPDSTLWTITVDAVEGGSRIEQRFEVLKLNPDRSIGSSTC